MSEINKRYILMLSMFIFVVIPSVSYAASESSILHAEFGSEINNAINAIVNDSGIKSWSMALALFIAFVTLTLNIIVWIRSADLIPLLTTSVLLILFGTLYLSYGTVVDTVYGACEQLGDMMYDAAIGGASPDAIYNSFVKAVSLPTVGIFDAMQMIGISIFWYLTTAILAVAIYFAEIWLVTGLALAKVVGVLFIPFVVSKYTHNLFIKWVQFFFLWGIAAIFLKVTSIICLVIMKASLNAVAKSQGLGDIVGSGFTADKAMQFTEDNISLVFALIGFTIVAAIMIFGSFKLAAQCLNGSGTAGNSLNNGAVTIAKKLAVLF
ncbi:TPA: hypothetical protein SMQ11_003822 [Proteus mirabilis]|nr:hypothetical protein [Proteus mirabilis]HEK1946726.1 hypothetical protein [Proteus mirabilis]